MVYLSNDKKLRLKRKKCLHCFGFGCDFLPFSSLWKLPIPLWIVTGKSQITHYSYRYVKTPYALNEAVQNAPLLHLPKSTQFKHPYCIACTWSRPNMAPLHVENRVLMVGYLSGSTTPGQKLKANFRGKEFKQTPHSWLWFGFTVKSAHNLSKSRWDVHVSKKISISWLDIYTN